MDIEELHSDTSKSIAALQNNPLLIRQFLHRSKSISFEENLAAYKQYIFVLLRFYEGPHKIDLIQQEFSNSNKTSNTLSTISSQKQALAITPQHYGQNTNSKNQNTNGQNKLSDLRRLFASNNHEFVYFEARINLISLLVECLATDALAELTVQQKPKRANESIIILTYIAQSHPQYISSETALNLLNNSLSPYLIFFAIIQQHQLQTLPQLQQQSAQTIEQEQTSTQIEIAAACSPSKLTALFQLAVNEVEVIVLMNSLRIKSTKFLMFSIPDLKLTIIDRLIATSVAIDWMRQPLEAVISSQLIASKIRSSSTNSGTNESVKYSIILMCQCGTIDLEGIRICADYAITDIDACISSYVKREFRSIRSEEIKEHTVLDMKQGRYRQGVYMVYLALKLQEVQLDIAFLYTLPLSFFYECVERNPTAFTSIRKEFFVLCAQFAPILSQTHLTFKRQSILSETKLTKEAMDQYERLSDLTHEETGEIIRNRQAWFSLFGISMGEVAAHTIQWYLAESISKKRFEITGCSDPMYFFLLQKRFFQSDMHLELLLCCIEVLMKNWEVFTDAVCVSTKEKQLNYIFQLNVQVTQFLIQCLSTTNETTKCDLLISDFINQYGLSNGLIIDHIIRNGFCENNIWKAVENIQWMYIGLDSAQRLLSEQVNEIFNLKFLTALVCKYKSLNSCKIAESILEQLILKIKNEIDGKSILAFVKCFNSMRIVYPELAKSFERCSDELKAKYSHSSEQTMSFSITPYEFFY